MACLARVHLVKKESHSRTEFAQRSSEIHGNFKTWYFLGNGHMTRMKVGAKLKHEGTHINSERYKFTALPLQCLNDWLPNFS